MSYNELYSQLIKQIFGLKDTKLEKENKELKEKLRQVKEYFENQNININNLTNKNGNPLVEILDPYTSKNILEENKTVDGLFRVIDTRGFGIITQIWIETTSNDYEIQLLVDSNIWYNKPYSYFFTYSDRLRNITAALDVADYYLSLQDISFQQGFSFSIRTSSSTLFDKVLVNYKIREEQLL